MINMTHAHPTISAGRRTRRLNSVVPQRYVFAVMAFLGMVLLYTLRVNMSVAIVAMVSFSPTLGSGNQTLLLTGIGTTCPVPAQTSPKITTNAEFDWNGSVRGMVLGSFFYGYIFTCFLGGWLGHKFGGKNIFGFSVFIAAVLTLLTPLAARTHYGILIATRALQGLANGVCFPAMETLISSWSPPTERTKFVGFIFSGVHIGMVLMFGISGYLSDVWGWPSIFYVFAFLACLWFMIWTFVVYETPFVHPYISEQELELITKDTAKPDDRVPDFPWRKAVRSLPFIATCVAHFGGNWGFFTLLTHLPTYLNKILHFDLKADGLLSALPYLTVALCSLISSVLSDWVRLKGYATTTTVRKASQAVGLVLPALCLVGVGYTCNPYIAMTLLIIGVGSSGAAFAGIKANFIDLSPHYAGILLGISATPAMLPGVIAPYAVGIITESPHGQTMESWRIVFYITAVSNIVSAVFYCIFASGETQNWNQEPNRKISSIAPSDESVKNCTSSAVKSLF